MTVEVKYTYADLLTTPDDRHRYEIFEGDLIVTPAPNRPHQKAHASLFRILSQHIAEHSLGEMYSAPFDVYFDEETTFEPDILFVAKARLDIIDEQKVNGAPDVVIEVISPSTESRDRGFKFKRYGQEGVKEYWLVDPTKKTIEIYQLGEKGFVNAGTFRGGDEVRSPYFVGLKFKVEEVWR